LDSEERDKANVQLLKLKARSTLGFVLLNYAQMRLREREDEIEHLIAERDILIAKRDTLIAERDRKISRLNLEILRRETSLRYLIKLNLEKILGKQNLSNIRKLFYIRRSEK
jgi:hypothetical protein